MYIAQTLKEHYGVDCEAEACRRLVNSFLPGLENAASPANVFDLARMLRVTVTTEANAAFEGRFRWDESGNEAITLGGTNNDQRRRFTVAHEIGHCILHRFLGTASGVQYRTARLTSLEHSEEERLANKIAAEILVPMEAIYNAISNQRITNRLIRIIAARFKVSRQVILRRATDVLNTTLVYICAIPNRFNNLDSISIIDSAMYVVPNKGLVKEAGVIRFLRAIPFREFTTKKSIRLAFCGSHGRVMTDFDVAHLFEPIPRAELLAADVIFRPDYQLEKQ